MRSGDLSMTELFALRRGAVRWLRALLACIVIGGLGACGASVSHAAMTPTCRKTVGPFRVRGTRVLQANGTRFVPYGMTLSTLEYYPGTAYDAYPGQTTLQQTKAQLRAIAGGWCANTVRLQIEQDSLVGVHGKAHNSKYLRVIKSAIRYAERLGLVVVVNDQTEPASATDTTRNEPLPTSTTVAFWHLLNKTYARDPQVVYDLFNEPRPYGAPGGEAAYWALWRNGGPYAYKYEGRPVTIRAIREQTLVNRVRRDGSKNLLWVEGLENQALDYLVRYPNTYLLRGHAPIVYTYHHTAIGLPHDAATWDAQFGGLVEAHTVPVVDGEWTNYANNFGYTYPNGDSGECWVDAPTTVPVYLTYLHQLRIGATAWTLAAGVMNSTLGNYVLPSQFGPNWSCNGSLHQGAGQLVQDWYLQYNRMATPPRRPAGHPSHTYHLLLRRSGTNARMTVTVAWRARSVDVFGTLVNRSRTTVRPYVVINPSTAKTRAVDKAVQRQLSIDAHKVTISTGWVRVHVRGGVRGVVLKIASVRNPRNRTVLTATPPRKR